MDDIKIVEAELEKAQKAVAKVKAKIDTRQQMRRKLLDEVKALNPEYGWAIADRNVLEKRLSALKNPDGVPQVVAVEAASEKGRN